MNPFLGVMGVAPATTDAVHSVPGPFGGNLDVNLIGGGSRLYLPVQVPGADEASWIVIRRDVGGP